MVQDAKEDIFPATVVEVIDEFTVVVNRGSNHGISEGDEFIIYRLSKDQIKDPTNGQVLGYLEIVKGKGKVKHVQERMSTIESNEEKENERTILRSELDYFDQEQIKIKTKKFPFKDPKVGDLAKLV